MYWGPPGEALHGWYTKINIDKSAEEVIMKTDALTLAAIIFVVGLLATGLSVSDDGDRSAMDAPAAELHQGVVVQR